MKKLLAILMAMLMAALPVLGMAGSIEEDMMAALKSGKAIMVESSAEMGEGFAAMMTEMNVPTEIVTVVSELVKAMNVGCYMQNGQVGLAVKSAGADLVTADVAINMDKKEAFIASNLLGDSVIRLNEDDLAAAQKYAAFAQYDELAAEGIITAEQAQELKDSYAPATMEIPMPDFSAVNFSELTMENTMAYFMSMMQKVSMDMAEDGSMNVSVTVTSEDSKDLFKALFADLKASESLMKAINDYLVQVEAPGTVEELMDSLLKSMEESASDVKVSVDANVSAEGNVVAAVVISNGSEDVRIDFTLVQDDISALYLVITIPDGRTVSFSLTMGNIEGTDAVSVELDAAESDGSKVLELAVNVIDSDEMGVFNGKMVVSGEELITVDGIISKDHTKDDVWVDNMSMNVAVNAGEQKLSEQIQETVTTIFGAAPEIMTETKVFVNESEAPVAISTSRIFTADAMPAVSADGAVCFADMDQATFEAWTAETVQNVPMAFMTKLIQNLPESVLQMLMQQQ